jgi:hypothetical protein
MRVTFFHCTYVAQELKKSMLMCQKNCKHKQLTKTVTSEREQTHCYVREGTPSLHILTVLNLMLIYGPYRDFDSDFDLQISIREMAAARWCSVSGSNENSDNPSRV